MSPSLPEDSSPLDPFAGCCDVLLCCVCKRFRLRGASGGPPCMARAGAIMMPSAPELLSVLYCCCESLCRAEICRVCAMWGGPRLEGVPIAGPGRFGATVRPSLSEADPLPVSC